jgi:hypothetical protein
LALFPSKGSESCVNCAPLRGAGDETEAKLLVCEAVGWRGRWMRRQGTRCEGYYDVMLSAPWTALTPAPGDGHTHAEHGHASFNGIDPVW